MHARGVERPREPGQGRVVAVVELGVGQLGVDERVGDQGHPLAEVVERRQLADHVLDRIGQVLVVGRNVGQLLDLAHHVVAEVADQAAVQGRERLVDR